MKIEFKKVFGEVLKTAGQVLTQTAYTQAAKSEKVQEAVTAQKVRWGKETLWSVFPFVILGGAIFFLVKGFK